MINYDELLSRKKFAPSWGTSLSGTLRGQSLSGQNEILKKVFTEPLVVKITKKDDLSDDFFFENHKLEIFAFKT